MTMTAIIRNAEGDVINIGAWDYQMIEVPTGVLDAAGFPIMRLDPSNPLPAGATEDTADVVIGWDGGRYLADDERRIHPDER